MNPFNKLKLPELDGPPDLFFGLNNAKLPKDTSTFSIPAGYTCPGACDCLSHFNREERKIIDGPNTEYRCFAASMEAMRPSVRKSVDRNLAILKQERTTSAMAERIDLSLPAIRFKAARVHVSGDFYNQSYFLAWMEAARRNPNREFYAYTKSLPFWIKFKKCVPENFVLTASRGGKWDNLIKPNKLRSTTVVYHPDEADRLGLEIDHDDSHARYHGGDFALLIHGQGPAGSKHSAAIKRLKAEGVEFSYGRGKKNKVISQ